MDMLSIEEILFFLDDCRNRGMKINNDLFYQALCFTKDFQEIKQLLNWFKGHITINVRVYGNLANFIDNVEDCRHIIQLLSENSKRNNILSQFYIQLILLSEDQNQLENVFNEAKEKGLELGEIWKEHWKNNNRVLEGLVSIRERYFNVRGKKLLEQYFLFLDSLKDYSISYLRTRAIETEKKNPKIRQISSGILLRNIYVKQYSKIVSKGICQLCEIEAPFLDYNGEPFLEVHHIEWLSKGGKDSIYNVVALCPNCHRKMHILGDENDVLKLKEKALKLSNLQSQ
jgi:5-methylcytosine-specific restriction endonuclease McrA